MNKHERSLEKLLAQWRTMIRTMGVWDHSGYTYHGIEDFVLSNGKWCKPRPFPRSIPVGAPRSCFNNAVSLAIRKRGELRYVEGFAMLYPDMPMPIHHAWNIDAEDQLIDSTWKNKGLAYIGIEFSVGRAVEALNCDRAPVLDNPARRNILYKDPWQGEDYSLKWSTRRKKSDGYFETLLEPTVEADRTRRRKKRA